MVSENFLQCSSLQKILFGARDGIQCATMEGVTDILVAHSTELLSRFLTEKKARNGQLALVLSHAQRTDVDGPTLTGTIMSGLDHCFDWPLWPGTLAPHGKDGRISKYKATSTEVADALQIATTEDGLTASDIIIDVLKTGGGGCCFGFKSRTVARILGVSGDEVGHYIRTSPANSEDTSSDDDNDILDDSTPDESLPSRFGIRSAPYPSTWTIPCHCQRAAHVLQLVHAEIGISFNTSSVGDLVAYASKVCWDAKTDEQKDAQRLQLRQAWENKTDEELAEIHSRAGDSISATLMAKTQEERSQPYLDRWAQKSEEDRRAHMNAAIIARTPAERGESSRRYQATRTPEQKTARGKAAAARLTAEERSKRSLLGNAKLSIEQKKARAQKGVEKRAEGYERRRQETVLLSQECAELEAQILLAINERGGGKEEQLLLEVLTSLRATANAAKSVKTSKKAKELALIAFPQAREAISLAVAAVRE